LGRPLCNAEIKTFADGESSIYIKEKISGKDVYIIQGTSKPVNDNVMQLFLLVSAAKRAGARSITVTIPYYGYAR
jgi:ribose-phosphate pyrophosphokinase